MRRILHSHIALLSLPQLEKHRWAHTQSLAAVHVVQQYIYIWYSEVEEQ